MEFKPNEITQDVAQNVVRKFKDHNKGVVVGNSKFLSNRNWDDVSAKWSDLMDSSKYSLKSIKEKMKEIYAEIRNLPEDLLLGDTTVAYRHKTERGKVIIFTYTDMYIFLREALKERMESAEYLRKKEQLQNAKAYIEANKSTDTKLKEAQELAAKLALELEDDENITSQPAANTATPTSTQA